MYFPTDDHRSSVLYPMDFSAVRVYGTTLHPAEFSLRVSLTPAHYDKRTSAVIEEKSEEGLQRLTFWKDTILENCLMMDINSELLGSLVGAVDNNVMFCPGGPTDPPVRVGLRSGGDDLRRGRGTHPRGRLRGRCGRARHPRRRQHLTAATPATVTALIPVISTSRLPSRPARVDSIRRPSIAAISVTSPAWFRL